MSIVGSGKQCAYQLELSGIRYLEYTCGFGGELVRRNSITDIIFPLQSFELELQCLLMGAFGRKEMMLSNIANVSTFS